uniref:Aquaporin FA-CHIP-like n=1 Tax=Callorhinchus milii TaxID=7868 RepID=A0A4W3HXC0_CALMI
GTKFIWGASEGLWRALSAEFLGTAVFVFASVGSALPWDTVPSSDPLRVAVGFGLGVSVASAFTRGVSGGHLNPALTLALLARSRLHPLRALLYGLAQALGAIAASALLYAVTPPSARGELGLNTVSGLSPGVSRAQGLGVEVVATFQLALVALAVSDERNIFRGSAHLTIGLSVTLGHLLTIGFTGCSMNPARSLGPAVVTSNFSDHWIFWVGPLLGGLAGAGVDSFILTPTPAGGEEGLKADGREERASRLQTAPRKQARPPASVTRSPISGQELPPMKPALPSPCTV